MRPLLAFALVASASLAGCDSDDGTGVDGGADTGGRADVSVATDARAGGDARAEAAAKHDAKGGGDAGAPDSTIGVPDGPIMHFPDGGSDDVVAMLRDAGHDGAAVDAGHDAKPADPGAMLAACAGTAMPITLSDGQPYVDLSVGSQKGEFVLDFGSTFSSIDLTAFASLPPTTGCNTSDVGGLCSVANFAFFGPPMTTQLTAENYSGVTGSVRQAGIVGTDLLRGFVFTIDYAGGHAYASTPTSFCSSGALATAGLVALSAAAFYENQPTLLESLTDVDDAGSPTFVVPDVPTVPVALAGVHALAQLDTGFADTPGSLSVNINSAFFSAITAAKPGALVRDASLDETLTTCVEGVGQPIQGYTLAVGTTFALEGAGGTAARTYSKATVYLKEPVAAASSCGGISTWSVPAAQMGASFYLDMQTIVFDPYGARVLVPAN
jgi:hypothetical protein